MNLLSARVFVDREMRVVCASAPFAALSGRPLEQVISDVDLDICLSVPYRQTLLDAVGEVLESGQPAELVAETPASCSVHVRHANIRAIRVNKGLSRGIPGFTGWVALQDDVALITFEFPRCEQDEHFVPARPERVREVVEAVHTLAAKKGFLKESNWKDALRLRLATEEALQNAIDHGCRGDASQMIFTSVSASADRVTVSVRDPGSGFGSRKIKLNPDRGLEERGRGLPLIRRAADSVKFNGIGNEVTMTFYPRSERVGLSRNPMVPHYLYNPRVKGMAVAATVVLFIAFSGLLKPTRQDALAEALRAMQTCQSVHVVGTTRQQSIKDPALKNPAEARMSERAAATERFELWWTNDKKSWLRMGDRVYIFAGNRLWMRFQMYGQYRYEAWTMNGEFTELTSPEEYLRSLTQGGAIRVETVATGDRDIITVDRGRKRDVVEVNRRTKALVATRTINNQIEVRRLYRFEYNKPLPADIAKAVAAPEMSVE